MNLAKHFEQMICTFVKQKQNFEEEQRKNRIENKNNSKGFHSSIKNISPTKLQFNSNVNWKSMPFIDCNETTTH